MYSSTTLNSLLLISVFPCGESSSFPNSLCPLLLPHCLSFHPVPAPHNLPGRKRLQSHKFKGKLVQHFCPQLFIQILIYLDLTAISGSFQMEYLPVLKNKIKINEKNPYTGGKNVTSFCFPQLLV